MQLVIDANVVVAYLLSGSNNSTNARVCRRVVNGLNKAFTCDILYDELNRILDSYPDPLAKISSNGKKEGNVFRALHSARREYSNSRLGPYVMQLNFVKTEDLTIDPDAIKDVGNDWYMISIAKYTRIDYVITWNTQDVRKYAVEYGIGVDKILDPSKYPELVE